MAAIVKFLFGSGSQEWAVPPVSPELEDENKYNKMENILHIINRKIHLKPEDIIVNRNALDAAVYDIIDVMKLIDPMFSSLFQRIFYGGSYFDGLKVKDPDEFDLDLLFTLPKVYGPHLEFQSNRGFAKVKLKDSSFQNDSVYRKMSRFVDFDNYVNPSRFRDWFKGVFQRACNEIVGTNRFRNEFRIRDSGPACTLIITIGNSYVEVDLVPCITFSSAYWPESPYRPAPKGEFFVVPKPDRSFHNDGLGWRLSFQIQEHVIIHGKDRLKCCIRLMKLLRDEQGHMAMSSYFIKTFFLWMISVVNDDFWSRTSLSYALMMALKYYCKFLEIGQIPYYWNKNFNLLENTSEFTISNFCYRTKRIIRDIEASLNSPDEKRLETVIFKYFASSIMTGSAYQQTIRESESYCVIL